MATPYYRGFQLGLLPERRMSWQTLATSYGIECIFILILLNIGLLFPDKLQVKQNYHITELIPLPSNQPKPIPVKPKPQPQMHAKLLPAVPVERPHLIVPKEVRVTPPPKPVEEKAPEVALDKFKAPELKQVAGGARPQLVHTGDFSTGSSAVPTVNAPVQKVQTGGFGDPNGVKGEGKPNAKLMIASTGSFELPQGPGQGNGTGGAKGIKGTVASAGFGNGVATGGVGDGRSNGRGSVATGGFGQQEVSQGVAKPRQLDSGPPTNPVEITFKPNPIYTPEARSLKLEGEVLLEVMFGANGQLHVNRVVRGLGHGLDEAAIDAANKMRFKPALRNGQPVDSTAIVHVVFQLAY